MKKILIGLLILVVVLVTAVVVVPMLIPLDTYKRQIEARVEQATGRKLTIGGDMSLSVFPALAVKVGDVRFANAPGASEAEMVRLDELSLDVALRPLLDGRLQVNEFVLVRPVIHLGIDEAGRPNWQFAAPGETGQPAPSRQPSAAPGGESPLADVSLGDIRIEDGTVTYADARTGTRETFEDVDLAVKLPGLDQPATAEGGLDWKGQRVALGLDIALPRALVEGGDSDLALRIDADPMKADFEGRLSGDTQRSLAGRLGLEVPSVRELAAWVASPIEAPEGTFGRLELDGTVSAGGTRASIADASLLFDDIRAKGGFDVETGGRVPSIKGKLAVEALNLNPYLGPEGQAAAGEGGAQPTPTPAPAPGAPAQPAGSAGWSDDPIDLSALQAVDAELDLTVGALQVRQIKVDETALALRLAGGKLALDLSRLAAYGGQGSGRLGLDGSAGTPRIDAAFTMSGLDAEPFLRDAADFERLEGKGNLDLQVSTQGASQRAMVGALGGKGGFTFTDGAIKGINLAAMVRNVTSAFADPAAREAQKTDFSELRGTFTIDKGILSNKDLTMLSPLLRLSGAGTANIPARTLEYRLEPRAAATLEGQGGREDVAGVLVPVIVEGPWDDLRYRPDLAALIKQDPRQTIESLRESGKDALKGILRQPDQGTGEGGTQPNQPDPVEQLKGLFGR